MPNINIKNFLRNGAAVLTSLLLVFCVAQTAEAAVGINKEINFQGKLVNADGTNVADGTYNMEFNIYQDGNGVPGGGDEALKWTEARLRNNSQGVVVDDGIFQVNLGAVTAFSGIDWNQSILWVSINVGNTNATCTPFSNCVPDGEMNPMVRFTATPYALNADKVGGLGTADLIVKAATANQTVTSTQTSGTVYGVTDTTGISAAIKGLGITLSGAGAFDQTGLEFNLSGASGTNLNDIVGSGSTWKVSTGGAATFASVGAGSGTITTTGTIGTAATTTFTGAGATFSSAIAANGGITFDAGTDTVGAHTMGGDIIGGGFILTDIGNTGTDFVASTGALTLAGVLTANGGISLAGSQSLTASALSYMDLGSIVHNTTAVQGLRLPQAASALPSSPSANEGYLAWDTAGNQMIVYNGSSWGTVGGGSGISTVRESDGSPSVGSLTTLEFGPASTSEDEFVVTDQTGGVARIVLGTKVVKTDATQTLTNKTIGSTGLTFSAAATDIDTAAAEGLVLQGRAASTMQTTVGNITLQPAGTGTSASVQIGSGGAGSTTPDLLVLDIKSDAEGALAGTNGAMYYNANTNKFRCYQNSAWTDCIGGGVGGGGVPKESHVIFFADPTAIGF